MQKVSFVSLQVSDLDASEAFYTTKLGFRPAPSPNPDACVFEVGGGTSFAIRKPLPGTEGRELGVGVGLWFAVDRTAEELQADFAEKGVPVIGGINRTPFGKTVIAQDPDGYQLTFLGSDAE